MSMIDQDRRSGRDRREGFVDVVLYGRLVSELVAAETELLSWNGRAGELVGDDPAAAGRREAFVLVAGRAEGLARAIHVVAGDEELEIRGRARELAREGAARHEGMSSIGDRTERALEVLGAAEASELCPVCGQSLDVEVAPEDCVLAEEHGADEIPLEVLKRSGLSLDELEKIHGERAPGA